MYVVANDGVAGLDGYRDLQTAGMKKALGPGLLCVLVGCSEPHERTGGAELAISLM